MCFVAQKLSVICVLQKILLSSQFAHNSACGVESYYPLTFIAVDGVSGVGSVLGLLLLPYCPARPRQATLYATVHYANLFYATWHALQGTGPLRLIQRPARRSRVRS